MATRRQSMCTPRLQNATLHPPALSPNDDDDDDGAEIPWVLLEERAYVADRRNATTAFSTTWDNKEIQVTLCLARPPRVSYICVFCPGREHTELPLEPKILAAEEDLVLLRVIVSSKHGQDMYEDADLYIYQAADMAAAGGGPSLKRLPRPPRQFESTHAGILRCGINHKQHHDQSGFVLRPHRDTTDDDFYVVAGLSRAHSAKAGEFLLLQYSSKVPTHWSTDNISLNDQQLAQYGIQHGCNFHHNNSKVIAIGGNAGTMGFVDLWKGILFCDVLKVEGKPIPPLRYVPLPPDILPGTVSRGDARNARDIAISEDEEGRMMIKYVELQVRWKPGEGFRGPYAIDGWVTRTWKRPVSATYLEDAWVEDCTRESSLIPVDNNPHFNQLPKVLDREGRPMLPFKGLAVRQPTLSLHDDDATVYFMIKKDLRDPKAWVIAVDMRKNALQDVTEFAADRNINVSFAYKHGRISRYLRQAQGTKGILKRQGMMLPGSSFKRPAWMPHPDVSLMPHNFE